MQEGTYTRPAMPELRRGANCSSFDSVAELTAELNAQQASGGGTAQRIPPLRPAGAHSLTAHLSYRAAAFAALISEPLASPLLFIAAAQSVGQITPLETYPPLATHR